MVWGDDAEVKILENQNKICSAMYDEEKNNIKLITPDKKQEIAETTSLQASDISDVVAKFKQLQGFHEYLKSKKDKNEPLPETRDELMHMYQVERPKFMMPKRGNKSYNQT